MPESRDRPEDGRRTLRSFHDALIQIGETLERRRYVLDSATGRPVMPMPESWRGGMRGEHLGEDVELAMYVPEDCDGCLQLLVTPTVMDPLTTEGADRWQVYHGRPDGPYWALLKVESAKWPEGVCDGDELCGANALRACESRLLRDLNADRGVLAGMCRRALNVTPEAPMAVGIDPDGFDVRGKLGIIRVEFGSPALDEDAAKVMIGRLRG